MKTQTFIYSLFVFFFLFSCGNEKHKPQEDGTTKSENASSDASSDDEAIDLFAEADEAEWEMDAETEGALAVFEKLAEGIEGFSSQMNLESLLNKHQLSRGELNRSIESITKERLGQGERTDPQQEAAAYARRFQQKMNDAGMGMSLEEAEEIVASYNKTNELQLTSKYNTKGSYQMVTEVLAPLQHEEPGFLEENLSTYNRKANNERKQTLMQLAGTTSKEEITEILTAYYGITEKELELLEKVPTFFDKIPSEKVAKASAAYTFPREIMRHLESGNASEKFSELVNSALEKKKKMATDFITFAKVARLKFYKENPNWIQGDNSVDNTYVDERGNFIFLPLGDLSFADAVVAKKLGKQGEFPNGALGVPDMSVSNFTEKHPNICNLGLNGSITLAFIDNTLTDVNGPDLYIFEMGAIEPTQLEISRNGTDWLSIGKIEGGTAMVDIAPYVASGQTFNYIRLTDLETRSGIPGADIDAVGAIGGAMLLSLDSAVLFDTGSAALRENAAAAIKELSEQIKGFPKGNIQVQGHTDSDGDSKSNMALSKERAKSVAAALQKYVSKTFQMSSEGFGENQPIAPNDTKENKQKNRRVEILITPKNQ